MLKLNEKLPAAVLLKLKLARQRRRSRWKVKEWYENCRVPMSYAVLQFAVQLCVGLNDRFRLVVFRPAWCRSSGVVSFRLRELDAEMPSVNPLPPPVPPPIPIPGTRGPYGMPELPW